MVDTADRPPHEPETVWGACRALLQAGAGAAFALEGRPTIGTLLILVAGATAVYETVRWWRWRGPGRRTSAGLPVTARPGPRRVATVRRAATMRARPRRRAHRAGARRLVRRT